MSSVEHDLDSFTRFVREKIQATDDELSLDALYDQWRETHSTADELGDEELD